MTKEAEDKAVEKLLTATMTTPVVEAPRDLYEVVITQWRAMRAKRLELEREARKAQSAETAFKSYAIEVFRQQKLEGVMINGRVTGLNTKSVAAVSDKEALVKYIKETQNLSLLQFRLATGTVDELKENGVDVPGVEYIDVYDLTDRKV
jgi:hypothetical protein